MPSRLETDLQVDDPLQIDADFQVDAEFLRRLDDQILAIQRHLTRTLINGVVGTYHRVDGASDALAVGDVVTPTATGTVTKANDTTLSLANGTLGIVLEATPPGGYVPVADSGVVPRRLTGLSPTDTGMARVNPSTGRVERVTLLIEGDYPLGSCIGGNVLMGRGFTMGASATALGDVASGIAVGSATGSKFALGGGFRRHVTKIANQTSYTMLPGDDVIAVGTRPAGNFTLNLHAVPTEGDEVTVLDASYGAAASNIIIGANNAANKVNNVANYVLATAGSSVTLLFTSNNWFVRSAKV